MVVDRNVSRRSVSSDGRRRCLSGGLERQREKCAGGWGGNDVGSVYCSLSPRRRTSPCRSLSPDTVMSSRDWHVKRITCNRQRRRDFEGIKCIEPGQSQFPYSVIYSGNLDRFDCGRPDSSSSLADTQGQSSELSADPIFSILSTASTSFCSKAHPFLKPQCVPRRSASHDYDRLSYTRFCHLSPHY